MSTDREDPVNARLLLAALRQCTGPAYAELRDTALAREQDLEPLLSRDRDHAHHERAVQARILDGWRAQGEGYGELIEEIDGVDVDAEGRGPGGLSLFYGRYKQRSQQLGPPYLPLYVERLLKHSESMPEWQHLLWLHMIEAVPERWAREPLLDVLVRAPSYTVQAAVMDTLLSLPTDGLAAQLATRFERHQGLAGILQRGQRSLSS